MNTKINYINNTASIQQDGEIFFDVEDYSSLVFEVKNNFIPANSDDVGGIVITKNEHAYGLFEYDSTIENKNYKYVKVYKRCNIFEGWGSENGVYPVRDDIVTNESIFKGSTYVKNAETIGVRYIGSYNYPIEEIKIYKDKYIIFEDLSEYDPSYVFCIVDKNTGAQFSEDWPIDKYNSVKCVFPYYPFNLTQYKAVVKDTKTNQIICDYIFPEIEIWGGDVLRLTTGVILLNTDKEPLSTIDETYLGKIRTASVLTKTLYLRPIIKDLAINVKVTISKNSMAYDWAELVDTESSVQGKSISFSLAPNQDREFQLIVGEPEDFVVPDEIINKYKIFLEVE